MAEFTVNEDYVEAEVYKDTYSSGAQVFLVKVKFLEIGTYISGVRVQQSKSRPQDGLWVQMPAAKVGARYFKIIECAGDSPFREIVERKANEAVQSYLGGKDKPYPKITDKDVPDVFKPDKGRINLDEIPF